MLSRGLILLCLLPWLTACGGRQIVRQNPVEVQVPVLVALDAELLQQLPPPELPSGSVTNEQLTDWAESLRAWGADGWCRLAQVAALQPGARYRERTDAERCRAVDSR